MPDWITSLLDTASWPARQAAEWSHSPQSGWWYFLSVLVLYAAEAAFVALLLGDFCRWAPVFAKQVGKWASLSGSTRFMQSAEAIVARIDVASAWLRDKLWVSRGRGDQMSHEKVPGDDAGKRVRAARWLFRTVSGVIGAAVKFVKLLLKALRTPQGLLLLAATIATVYPEAILDIFSAIERFAGEIPWTGELVMGIVTACGVFVAVGVVAIKGLLSDAVSARRHIRGSRNQEALESILPLALPLATVSENGKTMLEGICRRTAWQLSMAERWINRTVSANEVRYGDRDHLACDADCPARFQGKSRDENLSDSIELIKQLSQSDRLLVDENPIVAWRRELRRLSRWREWCALFHFANSSESLGEQIGTRLSFLAKDEFKSVRIRWQHENASMLIEEDSQIDSAELAAERQAALEQLAADYRTLIWDTLGELRVCQELADFAWRANSKPWGDRLAKVGS